MNRAVVNKNDFVIRIYLGSSTLDLSPRSFRPTGWRFVSKMAVAPNVGHGLAYVSRELDISPFRDGGWTNEHMNDAVVLPLGQKVLTLPADVVTTVGSQLCFLTKMNLLALGGRILSASS